MSKQKSCPDQCIDCKWHVKITGLVRGGLLRKATEAEAAAAHPMIGHNRFDEHCHDRMDDRYYACRARKS